MGKGLPPTGRPRYARRRICRTCGKHSYRDRDEALAALTSTAQRGRREQSVYYSERCHVWHLTSYAPTRGNRTS